MNRERRVKLEDRFIGDNEPVYVIAEIGINHNGSMDIARKLIDGATFACCNAVKFQKRTPELCVPKSQWHQERDTPWGRMTYIEYRHRVEFTPEQYAQIDAYCRAKGIDWFASCWDEDSVDVIEQFNPPIYKAPSASLTDIPLLKKMKSTGKPLIISTGMSTAYEIKEAVRQLGTEKLLIAHSTSAYPCNVTELNLLMIRSLREQYPETPVGYSGHEVGLAPSWAAISLGANFIERHVTLDRSMWGTDQAASVEILGMHRLIKDIRDIEKAMGDGVKRVYPSEMSSREKLRRQFLETENCLR
ncbi:MAG TPA: N-acetylneuraminate synthase [Nitrospiraceae bacterium]|jgi:N-acetylneuraminate synthase|nr:N-acetylneuraminate synthase [Nitrospiraceae bacterium]